MVPKPRHPQSTTLRQVAAAAAAVATFSGGAAAQEGESCPGAVIEEVFVDNHSIFNTAALSAGSRFGWVYSSANRMHRRTRESFIRNELLFAPGDCLSPLLVQESERILRSYPFIAEADIYPVEMPNGDVHVVVDTEDEWTTKFTAGVTLDGGFRVTDLGVTEENFLGRGTLVSLFMKEQDEERNIGATVGFPRALGTRANFILSAGSTRTGAFFQQRVSYPFVGEVGRYAALESFDQREELFAFAVDPDASFTNVVLPVERGNAEATLVARVGRPGDFTVVGGGISWERIRFANFPSGVRVVPGSDFSEQLPADSATIAIISRQITPREATRIHLVAGRRNVRFVARRGLDAIRGEQDIRVGTQVLGSVGLTLGRPTTQVEGASDELWGRLAVFAGAASSEWVINADLNVEGARLFTGSAQPGSFRDVLAELQVNTYWQPRQDSTHTFAARFAASGGWSSSLPFQLTLGGRDALRGFEQEAYPGGRRLLLNVEDRIRFGGPFRSVMDLGNDPVRGRGCHLRG